MDKFAKEVIRYSVIAIEVTLAALFFSLLFGGGAFSLLIFAKMYVLVGMSVFAIPLLLWVHTFQVYPIWFVYVLIIEWLGVAVISFKELTTEDEPQEEEGEIPSAWA